MGEGLKLTVDRGLRAVPWLCPQVLRDAVTGGGGGRRVAALTARRTPEGASPLYQQTPGPVVRALAGAVLMEQNDEWTKSRRYMGVEVLAKISAPGEGAPPADKPQEVTAIQAISA